MDNKEKVKLGSTFYLRRPTKTQIKKHGLTVTTDSGKKDIPAGIRFLYKKGLAKRLVTTIINDVKIPSEWFGSTVLYTNSQKVGKPEDRSIDGFDSLIVTIIDKERIKRKSNISHLIGKKIKVPSFLLRSKGMIIDYRDIPGRAHVCIRDLFATDPAHLFGSRIDTEQGERLTAPELIALSRQNHVCNYENFDNQERASIDFGIALMNMPRLITSITSAFFEDDPLTCACGHACTFSYLMSRIIDHTDKKKPKYKYTYTCPMCRTKYEIVDGEMEVEFKGVASKKGRRLVPLSVYFRAERQREEMGEWDENDDDVDEDW